MEHERETGVIEWFIASRVSQWLGLPCGGKDDNMLVSILGPPGYGNPQ